MQKQTIGHRDCIKPVLHWSLNSNDFSIHFDDLWASDFCCPGYPILFSRRFPGTPVERPCSFVKPVPQSGNTCWFWEISISIIIELRSCMVLAQSARLCARGGGGRMHVVGDGLGRGRGRCVVSYNTCDLTQLVRTRCAVNDNMGGLTHLARTGCVVNCNTWTKQAFFQNCFHILLGESLIWIWNFAVQTRAFGHSGTA